MGVFEKTPSYLGEGNNKKKQSVIQTAFLNQFKIKPMQLPF